MCQRVLIAMAFASDPTLVIADEPTTALDVTIQARIIELIADMQKRDGTAVIFITHDLRLAAQICDEISFMYAGRAVERGPARALLSAPAPSLYALPAARQPAHERRAARASVSLPEQHARLAAIAELAGCRFAPRCPIAVDRLPCRGAAAARRGRSGPRARACIRAAATRDHRAAAQRRPAPRPHRAALLAGRGSRQDASSPAGCSFGARTESRGQERLVQHRAGTNSSAIVGESGSGKSTIARLLVGLGAADAPAASLLDGARRDRAARRERARCAPRSVQMVFQDPQSALNPRRRVASIVTQAMEAGSRHASWEERLERARELLAEIGLAPETCHALPVAALRRPAPARQHRARAVQPCRKMLVADEIVSGLDVSIQAQLLNLLLRLRAERGFAMLFISHDLSVCAICAAGCS